MADNITLQYALRNELNILIVSSNSELTAHLQESLYSTWKQQQNIRPYNCKFHITSDLASLTEESCNQVKVFDFFVFLIEPKFISYLKEVESNLAYLGARYARQKICLVALGVSPAINIKELWTFAQIYQFNLLIGELTDSNRARNLSSRILNLCEACCGLRNGIPLIGKV